MHTTSLTSICQIDWNQWIPTERTALLFVIQNRRILLIHKKRGLGAGNITGPGGHINEGETAIACAIRETQEELGINAFNISECGKLYFQFQHGVSIYVTVFRAENFQGVPCETEEAIPLWFLVDKIPYSKMWKDDAYWIPYMLAGIYFRGYFIFNQSKMIDYKVDLEN